MKNWARNILSAVLLVCAWLIFFEEYRPAIVVALCGLSVVAQSGAWKVRA